MKYVYLVYTEWHGLEGLYASREKAAEKVKANAKFCELPKNTPLDYESEERWGWEGASWWVREEVIE